MLGGVDSETLMELYMCSICIPKPSYSLLNGNCNALSPARQSFTTQHNAPNTRPRVPKFNHSWHQFADVTQKSSSSDTRRDQIL